MEKIEYRPIGFIKTPFIQGKGAPIQPRRSGGAKGQIEMRPDLVEALSDLDGFSHIILIFHFHLSTGYKLKVVPYMDTAERGVFATRAPRRPNQIGLSVVRLEKIEGNVLHVADVDMLDGTPLLDIKPYVPHFDTEPDIRIGWLEGKSHHARQTRDDGRFEE